MMHRDLKNAKSIFYTGQKLAWRAQKAGTLWQAGKKHGLGAFIKPLNSPTRYPEYMVVHDLILEDLELLFSTDAQPALLDVGSPKLFSLLLAKEQPVTISSIDIWDIPIKEAEALAGGLSVDIRKRLKFFIADVRKPLPLEALPRGHANFDVAYAISVVEHVEPNPAGDIIALKAMSNKVKTGGSIIISVPVDAKFRDEYTKKPAFGVLSDDGRDEDGRCFFQRVYDSQRLHDLCSFVENELAVEEIVYIQWPQNLLFKKFWGIKNTKIRGLLGPLFPYFAPRFSITSSSTIVPITAPGDCIIKFRKKSS